MKSNGLVGWWIGLVMLFAFGCSTAEEAPEVEDGSRSKDEFIEYVSKRMPNLEDEQLDEIFAKVDKDGDGRVSATEFEGRMEAVSSVRGGGRRRRPPLPTRDMADKDGDYEKYKRQAVPRDSFPVFDEPELVKAEGADVDDDEPVIGVVCDGEARAYPVSVMGIHELGNDVCGETHITVSW